MARKKEVVITARVTTEMKKQLEMVSEKQQRSVGQLVLQALECHLGFLNNEISPEVMATVKRYADRDGRELGKVSCKTLAEWLHKLEEERNRLLDKAA